MTICVICFVRECRAVM